jgi:hypothetical protein
LADVRNRGGLRVALSFEGHALRNPPAALCVSFTHHAP